MNTPIPALALLALLVAACSSAPAADDDPTPAPEQASGEEASADVAQRDYHLTFRDRTIDLYPYVQGFPYAGLMPDLEFGHMLYFETTPDAEVLRILDIEPDEPIDLTEGRQLGDVDWSTRSFRYGEYNPLIERFVFLGDESNDEEFNLFTLDLDSGDIDALTDVDYIYGFGFSPDHQTLGYIARHGDSEPFNSCLTLLDLEEHSEEQIWCDEGGADRLTWSYVDFAPDGDSLIVRMQHDGDRSTTNIGRFHADAPGEPELLLERGVEHLSLWWLEDSYDGDELIYVSSHTGINNLYRHRLEDDPDDSKALTDLSHDITSAAIVGDDDPALMLIQYLPTGSILELLDPTDGTALYRRESDDNLSLRDHHGATSLLTMASVHTPFRMQVADLHRDGDDVDLHTSHFASLPEELADQLIQCDVTQVDFPTFDEVDGTPRMLHGYYYEPLEPPEDAQRLVQLTAFYGGATNFAPTTRSCARPASPPSAPPLAAPEALAPNSPPSTTATSAATISSTSSTPLAGWRPTTTIAPGRSASTAPATAATPPCAPSPSHRRPTIATITTTLASASATPASATSCTFIAPAISLTGSSSSSAIPTPRPTAFASAHPFITSIVFRPLSY